MKNKNCAEGKMHQIEVSTKFLTNAMVTCTKVDCVFEVSSHAL